MTPFKRKGLTIAHRVDTVYV